MEIIYLIILPFLSFLFVGQLKKYLNNISSIIIAEIFLLFTFTNSIFMLNDQMYTDIELIFFHFDWWFKLTYNMPLGYMCSYMLIISIFTHAYAAYKHWDSTHISTLISLLSFFTSIFIIYIFIESLVSKYIIINVLQLLYYFIKNFEDVQLFYTFLVKELKNRENTAIFLFFGYIHLTVILIFYGAFN